jgi:periplasmic protein TonB
METEKNYSWDDIVFEYKNKDYGAFFLRKTYNKSLFTASVIGAIILILIVVPVYIVYNKYKNPDVFIVDNSITVDLMNIKHQKKESPPPSQLPPINEYQQKAITTTQVVDNVTNKAITPAFTQVYDSTLNNQVKDVAFSDTGKVNSDGSFDYFTIEEKPEFPGGEAALLRYISSHVKYPEIAMKNEITGKVFILFIINQEGKVTDVELLKGADPSLDEEALRVVSGMPIWKPGKQRGKPVRVSYKIPINFKL